MKKASGPATLHEWSRAHIVTPILNAGQGIAVVTIATVSAGAPEGSGSGLQGPALLGVIFAASCLVTGASFLAWRFNEFRLGDDAVYHRKGILFRQSKQARLDRLQAVDVVQPLIPRIFGFSEVKVEVAGGRGSAVRLQYFRADDAEALRNEVLALAAGVKRGRTPSSAGDHSSTTVAAVAPTAEAPEREIYRVPAGRLLASFALSWTTIALLTLVAGGMVVGALIPGIAWNSGSAAGAGAAGGGMIAGFAAVFGYVAALWPHFNTGFNFTAGIAADGIRLSHGLLDTRRQTVPPGRIQAIRLRQSLLWRRLGWWNITVNVAGYQDEQGLESTLLPVGTRSEALHALWLVLPDLGDPDPAGTIATAMNGVGAENGFTASPARSWIFDPFQWKRRGVRATDRALLIRRGLFVREFFVIPHERTQSLLIRQGPLQQALRLATIVVHSTHGPVRPVAGHLDLDDARQLIEAQARRAREGRARQTPEQWMAAVSR